jgi:rare lipoprotein A
VVNKKNGLNVIVRVNDRGPFVKHRIIDLTESAARRIGGYHAGVVPVRIEEIKLIKYSSVLDSIYSHSSVVDCFGNAASPQGYMLSLWTTNDLVHAIYVAADFFLKEDIENVYIANRMINGSKVYHLLVGDIVEQTKALELKAYYEQKGFMRVSFFKN